MGTPVSPASTTSAAWSDVTVIPTGTECDCTYEPTSSPVAPTSVAQSWSDYTAPAVPTVATTIAVVPIPSGTAKPSSPVSPVSSDNGASPVSPFTGAAAEQQLTSTVFSVAVCVAVAVAGLFL